MDSEEIAADVVIRVHKSVKTFNPRGGAKLTTWIFRIAQNAAIDFVRQQQKISDKQQRSIELNDSIGINILDSASRFYSKSLLSFITLQEHIKFSEKNFK